MLRRIARKLKNNIYKLIKGKTSILDYHIHPTAILYDKKNIKIHKSALLAEFVIVRAANAELVVGENSQIGPSCVFLTGTHGIKIGKDVMIAPNCVFAAGSHEFRNLEKPMLHAGSFSNGPIIIEEDVWIGANCTILDNVTIGKGAIVGANSVVNKDIPPYEIAGGVPAKKLDSRLKYKK